jgi:hypothetical protein
MATFSIKLTDLQLNAWFQPTEPLSEQIITHGTGVYTVSVFGTSIGYYLQVDSGERVNPLRLGQPVQASGRDPDGKVVSTEVLETINTGVPALFKGPYHAALAVAQPAGAAPASRAPFGPGERVLTFGGGAQFWAYVSPSNNTAHAVTRWQVKLTQGNWSDTITSDNPRQFLATPGLSGIFDVTVVASGPKMPEKRLSPQAGSKPNIGCNNNCSAMVGIVASEDGTDASYWTVWDALCGR